MGFVGDICVNREVISGVVDGLEVWDFLGRGSSKWRDMDGRRHHLFEFNQIKSNQITFYPGLKLNSSNRVCYPLSAIYTT